MKFFKPEDFHLHFGLGQEAYESLAATANAKLEKEGRVVYADVNGNAWEIGQHTGDVVKALLINIEPIQACTHPAEKVQELELRHVSGSSSGNTLREWSTSVFKCECGAKVRPKEFEEVK